MHRMTAYVEGSVVIDGRNSGATFDDWRNSPNREGEVVWVGGPREPSSDQRETRSGGSQGSNGWLGNFESLSNLEVRVASREKAKKLDSAIIARAQARREARRSPVRRAQFEGPVESGPGGAPPGTRRLSVHQRSSTPVQAEVFPSPDGKERVFVATGGVNIILDGVGVVEGLGPVGSLDLSADRVVLWTQTGDEPDPLGETIQDRATPLEIYMEGNIVFRQGDRVVYADRLYYDARANVGTILDAELLTPTPTFQGLARMKARVLRQTGPNRFFAEEAYFTTSRIGRPRYRVQSQGVSLEDNQRPRFDPFTGAPEINPQTGEQVYDHERLATGRNNFLFLGPAPVFYWPRLATNLDDPSYFVRGAQVQNDRIFGTWGWVEFDTYQLLGIRNKPQRADWNFSVDYLSHRGFGAGTTFRYDRAKFFGAENPATGFLDFWALHDRGFDNLGRDRRHLTPENRFRYRVYGNHRQMLPGDFQLSAEVGLIGDRNFLEQYYEREWDQLKDQTTGIDLKRLTDNRSLEIVADLRVNDFFTQTEWLPRGDHFWLGQPLLADRLTWFEHSQAAFARLRVASNPTDPADRAKFALLPWEATSTGGRFVTRQEFDLPFDVGPVKVVPYALGEVAYWSETLDGGDRGRLFGQFGVRASVPFWSVNPAVESQLFNVHGLAHKIVVDGEFSYADANRSVGEFPLYDPLDDDSVEHFRRRFAFNTFSGITPKPFDERFYALRFGLQDNVTSPSTEIAGDLMAARVGVRQRWQTKRGPPDRRRIVDWIVLDTEMAFFPKPTRDNFGSSVGLLGYDFRWHAGDRLTFVSAGVFDFFKNGQENVNVGVFLSRPPRADWYFGFRSMGGPLHSRVVSTSYSYRLSPKWILAAGTSIDLGGSGNIGQNFSVTRIGESFLTSFGFNVDAGKNNVGVNLLIEPRVSPKGRLGRVAGMPVGPAGLYGLE